MLFSVLYRRRLWLYNILVLCYVCLHVICATAVSSHIVRLLYLPGCTVRVVYAAFYSPRVCAAAAVAAVAAVHVMQFNVNNYVKCNPVKFTISAYNFVFFVLFIIYFMRASFSLRLLCVFLVHIFAHLISVVLCKCYARGRSGRFNAEQSCPIEPTGLYLLNEFVGIGC